MGKAPAVKQSFGAGVLSGLRQQAGTTKGGEPLHLPLDQIAEDPDQPRKVFSETELEQMAETIRLVGVLSPVGVRKREEGGYALVFGARRLRGSRLAGVTTIPAVLVPKDQATLAVQVIENQARTGLSNSDLAAVVNRLFADKMTVKQIAVVCNIKEYQVAAFRSAEKLPACLRDRLDSADMRALYDLSRAWEKHPAEVEEELPDEGTYITITDARRIIEAITGKVTGSVILRREDQVKAAPEPTRQELPLTVTPPVQPVREDEPATPVAPAARRERAPAQPVPSPPAPATRSPDKAPAAQEQTTQPPGFPEFVMELTDGRRGLLITERRAGRKGMALLDVDGEEVAAKFSDLRPVDVD
ncbi:ParB/RepB/Spo0J family partition protein (plasmid) [Lichenicola cladoniae]|uniref:ParB/RepB/Spo0J family partition protein n=1 Tax=Lichenicola cladoniae TaxID=1484109 RepID=A0A6M8I0N5_9PROT|nr:ParB/RepB/Spo0J family partition protein [Lichenicola cladoniae]NPD70353.1 ParB/RepB/Spo0J family partition protein [Acetobacteraceae bacterium]QKE94008.1 ParB/RepB/Spo0J family partition protein [Lichenicola cladoniae]